MQDVPPPQAQQQEQRSMPVAADPTSPAVAKPEGPKRPALPPTPGGMGYLATIGLGLGSMRTELSGAEHGTTTGGGFLSLNASGFSESFSLAGRLTAFIGGGSGGMDTVASARLYIGGGPAVTDRSQIFARIGAEGASLKNDEMEASFTSIPAMQIGYQLWGHDVGFEIAPRIGLAPRTEYEPGDESLGRRHWRRLGVRAATGGSVFFTAGKLFAIDASYTRVVDEDPVDHVDGRVCVTPFYVALCGFGQYWRSIATLPIGPAAQEIPTTYIGGSLGFGLTGASGDKMF